MEYIKIPEEIAVESNKADEEYQKNYKKLDAYLSLLHSIALYEIIESVQMNR